MDEILMPKNTEGRPLRFAWKPRFRVTTLLWFMVILTAFFCGRQSKEIQIAANNWWKVTRVRWGANIHECEIVMWPPGSITVNEPNPIQQSTVYDPNVASASFAASNQICISPKTNGKTLVTYMLGGGSRKTAELELEFENGQVCDWMLTHK
jgi:hypothetical protein